MEVQKGATPVVQEVGPYCYKWVTSAWKWGADMVGRTKLANNALKLIHTECYIF
jgi:hypothetical protein